ncbi:MAG: hypothetical protein HY897_20805 [Deltaproteobacteria bacterium]|nr:hypothetical protein [Deltaproteobacteria bacterium]
MPTGRLFLKVHGRQAETAENDVRRVDSAKAETDRRRPDSVPLPTASIVVFLALVVGSCNGKSASTSGTKDVGTQEPPLKKTVYLNLYNPTCTRTAWTVTDKIILSPNGDTIPDDGELDETIKKAVMGVVFLYEGDTTHPFPIADIRALDAHPHKTEIVPGQPFKEESQYYLVLKSGKEQSAYDPLVVRRRDNSEVLANESIAVGLFTHGNPLLSEILVTTKDPEGRDVVTFAFSEDLSTEDIVAAPAPELLFDDSKIDACVEPRDDCRTDEARATRPAEPRVQQTDGRDISFISTGLSASFQEMTLKIAGGIRGSGSDLATGSVDDQYGTVDGDSVSYKVRREQFRKLPGNDTYYWCSSY